MILAGHSLLALVISLALYLSLRPGDLYEIALKAAVLICFLLAPRSYVISGTPPIGLDIVASGVIYDIKRLRSF